MNRAAAIALASVLWAGTDSTAQPAPARLENSGAPLRIPSPCSEEDIRALSLTCPPEHPCAVFLELAGFEHVGRRLFLTGNLHTESATLAAILLASEDEGASWYEPVERIRSAALDQIEFFDLETGWVAGYFLHALPRDPFLLITGDGGRTWRRRPLWAESKIGLIEDFHFDSRQHGWLWVDRASPGEAGRYELYETMTGGESWMLRQISDRPISRKAERAPKSQWRLRPDAPSHSYLLERYAGKWEVVASFLIPVGECREPELAVPGPPEPPATERPAEPLAPETPPAPRKPPSLKRKPQ